MGIRVDSNLSARTSTHFQSHVLKRSPCQLDLASIFNSFSIQSSNNHQRSSHLHTAQQHVPVVRYTTNNNIERRLGFATRYEQRQAFRNNRLHSTSPTHSANDDNTFRLISQSESPSQAPSQLSSAYAYFSTHLRNIKRQKQCSSNLVDRVDAHRQNQQSAVQCNGDRKMREVDRMLHSLKINYSADQMMFFTHMKEAVMPAVYKDEWESNAARVMELHNLKRVKRFVKMMTPRRMGKTTAVAAFVLSLLVGAPGIEISVFSTGQRASSSLMETVKRMMSVIPELSRKICREDQENLYIAAKPLPKGCSAKSEAANRARTMTTTSRLHSFPDSVDGKSLAFTTLHSHCFTSQPAPRFALMLSKRLQTLVTRLCTSNAERSACFILFAHSNSNGSAAT